MPNNYVYILVHRSTEKGYYNRDEKQWKSGDREVELFDCNGQL